jgi:hypothetical protein
MTDIPKRYLILTGAPLFEQTSLMTESELTEENGFSEKEIQWVKELPIYQSLDLSDGVANRYLVWRIH